MVDVLCRPHNYHNKEIINVKGKVINSLRLVVAELEIGNERKKDDGWK